MVEGLDFRVSYIVVWSLGFDSSNKNPLLLPSSCVYGIS